MKQGISAKASLEHVVFYPPMVAREYPIIVALRGRGTDEYDLLPLVEALGLDNVLVVSPRAPLSGYVPVRLGLQTRLHGLSDFPVFVSHGAYDEVIPVELGRESARALKAAGADVAYHEYQMGHEVREETLRDLNIWIRRLMH
jgi:phospholipase/carboxylesterase